MSGSKLRDCGACGNQISRYSPFCRYCGHPQAVPLAVWIIGLFLFLLFLFFLIMVLAICGLYPSERAAATPYDDRASASIASDIFGDPVNSGRKAMTAWSPDEAIRDLERKIEALKALKPAHDFVGAYEMQLLTLEDELDEKRNVRWELDTGKV